MDLKEGRTNKVNYMNIKKKKKQINCKLYLSLSNCLVKGKGKEKGERKPLKRWATLRQ